ncbi:hypothetical protein GCM10023090_14990 [Acidovorax lacteus]|uniref:IPTL-CTERM sorting domain-containing protein n=1 Tax=Acidovorax lacteus TaxID=1924988 RepID=A0ABP8L5D9_9BURK
MAAFALAAWAACTPLRAAPVITTIAEDSFAYTANAPLPGNNGGTGWSGPWASDSNFFTSFNVGAASLTVPGLTSSGGRIVFRTGGSLLNDSARSLPLQNTGVVFVQFLSQFSTQSGGGTPSIRLFSGSTIAGGAGNNGSCGSPVYAILDSTLQAPIASACSTVPLSTLAAVVLRIDYTANNTRMWVLSSLTGFDYLNPPAPSAEYAGLAPAFNKIAVYTRNPGTLDELKVFRVSESPAAPQPVPVGGLALWGAMAGALALLAARRLHSKR